MKHLALALALLNFASAATPPYWSWWTVFSFLIGVNLLGQYLEIRRHERLR
jgi:hypothetical protein